MNRLAETTHNIYSCITENRMKVWVITLWQIHLHLMLLFYRIFIDSIIHFIKRRNVKVIAVLHISSEYIYLFSVCHLSLLHLILGPCTSSRYSSHTRTEQKILMTTIKSAWQSFRCQVMCSMWSSYVSKILTSLSCCTN